MDNSDKDIKKALESADVPEEISPENMKKLLDEKAVPVKRKNIKKTAGRSIAAAVVFAVVCGTGAYCVGRRNLFDNSSVSVVDGGESSESVAVNSGEMDTTDVQNKDTDSISFMDCAESYEQVYNMFSTASENFRNNSSDITYGVDDDIQLESAVDSVADSDVSSGSSESYSNTYNQEDGVLEDDIAVTDGTYIYYLYNEYTDGMQYVFLNTAEADSGKFSDSVKLNLTSDIISDDEYVNSDVSVYDGGMYIYNDMLVVIGDVYRYYYDEDYAVTDYYSTCQAYGSDDSFTFVNFYTTGINPQLIGSYRQDGSYSDVRITPDGYMYLITNYTSDSFDSIGDAENTDRYIPSYTENDEKFTFNPDDILLPEEGFSECRYISYTVVGSLDLNTYGEVSSADRKAIAGFSGNVYCSEDNLYTVSGYTESTVTRISLDNGMINPAASCKIDGYVNDQFSMSEYQGYFRIAVTNVTWTETQGDGYVSYSQESINNYVYVLDMELNVVGSIGDFGVDEIIRSVNFSGNMAYVVTYEQTDPLFAIDLTDPGNIVILDEYSITGYSSYMQSYGDNLLLGFGVNADEEGVTDGVKIVMFDTDNPENLDEVGIYIIDSGEHDSLYSDAVWYRKALLIDSEKNLIGVPVTYYDYYDEWYSYHDYNKYMFFSYDNGEFVLRGEVTYPESENSERVIYIGDYLYVLSSGAFISADMDTIEVTDNVDFT